MTEKLRICRTCDFWDRAHIEPFPREYARCCRWPPCGDGQPQVYGDNWCGEWQPAKGGRE